MSHRTGSHPVFGRKLNRDIGRRHAEAERARNPKGRYGWKYRKHAPMVGVVRSPLSDELARLQKMLGM